MTPKFIFETMKKNEILSGNCSWSEYNIRCHMVRNDDEAFVSIFDFDGFDCIQVSIPAKVCNALKVSF